MKPASFDQTPEFQHFRGVMRGVLTVPKERVDELVREAHDASPRKDNPDAPGRKSRRRVPKRSASK